MDQVFSPVLRPRHLLMIPVLLLWAAQASLAPAQPVPFAHPDGTTHWYEAVAATTGLSWDDAHAAALQSGGHLATITSPSENSFVFGLIDSPAFWIVTPQGSHLGPWIGGVQPSGSPEPAGNWQWVTGEPLGFANWSPLAPDNLGGNQDRVHFGEAMGARVPTWEDLDASSTGLIGYVIEWSGHAPDQTVGLFRNRSTSFDGYTLLAPIRSDTTYLIDNAGRVVHSWTSAFPTQLSAYLLDNGDLLRAMPLGNTPGWGAGVTGRVEQHDWNGSLLWAYEHNTPTEVTHHDIERLPNGNVLMIAWERKTPTEAIAAGRDPALITEGELWPEVVIEVAPTGPTSGTVVWEWHLWDHLVQDFDPSAANFGVVANHPELLDLNYGTTGQADWIHANAIDYNPQLDQIVLSIRGLSELWVIDHSTSTAQAAGHTGGNSGKGGDFLYRWGNPEAYGAGTPSDRKLFFQHDVQWIEPGLPGAGNLLAFNNGEARPTGDYSSVDEIVPPVDALGNYALTPGTAYGPAAATWEYHAVNPSDFYAMFISGAQRLPNGNTLICSGTHGTLFEVTTTGECVWKYINSLSSQGNIVQGSPVPFCGFAPCNGVFKVQRYAASHPGLAGRTLDPGWPVELYPVSKYARFGSINLGNGGPHDVLLADGSAGDVWRSVHAHAFQPVTLSLSAPPAGPASAAFALYLLFGEPGFTEMQVQPAGIGVSCINLPLVSGLPIPATLTVANNVGLEALLGAPLMPWVTPAPSTVFQGFLPTGTYTLQGYMIDFGSAGPNVSLTNAIVLNML